MEVNGNQPGAANLDAQVLDNPELRANLQAAGLNEDLQAQIMGQINRRVEDGIRALVVAGPLPAIPAAPVDPRLGAAAPGNQPAMNPAVPQQIPIFNWGNIAVQNEDQIVSTVNTILGRTFHVSTSNLINQNVLTNEIVSGNRSPGSSNPRCTSPQISSRHIGLTNNNQPESLEIHYKPVSNNCKRKGSIPAPIIVEKTSEEPVGPSLGGNHTPQCRKGKRGRSPGPIQPDSQTTPQGPTKKRLCRTKIGSNNQPTLFKFFSIENKTVANSQLPENEEVVNQEEIAIDHNNVAHLLALNSSTPSSEDISEEVFDNKFKTKSVLFNPRNEENVLQRDVIRSDVKGVLNGENVPDQNKIWDLIKSNRVHNENLIKASITRAKKRIQDLSLETSNNPNSILSGITQKEFNSIKENNRKKRRGNTPINVPIPIPVPRNESYVSFQQENLAIPETARATWSQARNSQIEAARNTNRAAFYREAPALVNEYWTNGLEKVPQYLLKLPEFRSEMHAMRISHANELMVLAARHLEMEARRCTDSAAALKATSVTVIQQVSPDTADQIVTKANTGLDITVANMSSQEFRELEKRRQVLEKAPPTISDTIDPASNLSRTLNKPDREKGFQGRGQGRGGSRSWRGKGNRGKPYARGAPE